MAVGIIGAQSIGEPGTQLTMRTFHIGGVGQRSIVENESRAKKTGVVQFTRLKVVRNDAGEQVVLTRNGEIQVLDPKGRELEKYEVPAGAILLVEENQEVKAGTVLCQWDPHSIPILAEVNGKVRYEDVIEGETMRIEKDPSGHVRRMVLEHKGDFHPQVVLEDASGKILDFYYLPEKAYIEVNEGDQVTAGTLLAKTPREVSGTQDITGGLPRVTEIFEARKPKDPAVIAEIDGTVELLGEKRRGKRTIIVRSESGIEREHLVSHGKHLRVHAGDFVRAGEALVDGPLVPHDILRISGEEAVQQYLVREIQNVYRSQRVEIDDKHIEIIVCQMLRKVRIESVGDTGLLPGSVMDKFEFRAVNQNLSALREDHRKGRQRFRRRHDRPQGRPGASQRPDRSPRRRAVQGNQAQAGHGQHAIARHHQGGRAKLQLHLGRQLPGNHQGAHRSGPGRQGRPSGRLEGKRDPRPLDPRRHRLPHVPRFGSADSQGSLGSLGPRAGTRLAAPLPALGNRRRRGKPRPAEAPAATTPRRPFGRRRQSGQGLSRQIGRIATMARLVRRYPYGPYSSPVSGPHDADRACVDVGAMRVCWLAVQRCKGAWCRRSTGGEARLEIHRQFQPAVAEAQRRCTAARCNAGGFRPGSAGIPRHADYSHNRDTSAARTARAPQSDRGSSSRRPVARSGCHQGSGRAKAAAPWGRIGEASAYGAGHRKTVRSADCDRHSHDKLLCVLRQLRHTRRRRYARSGRLPIAPEKVGAASTLAVNGRAKTCVDIQSIFDLKSMHCIIGRRIKRFAGTNYG